DQVWNDDTNNNKSLISKFPDKLLS
ncbi:unnamed protein product, partial [Rotaria sp. Silwood1]